MAIRASTALPQLQLAARISSPQQAQAQAQAGPSLDAESPSGEIDWTGRFALAPLHRLMPYAGSAVPVALLHADSGFQGRVQARLSDAGWQASTDGDPQINELQLNTRPQPGQPANSANSANSAAALASAGAARPGADPGAAGQTPPRGARDRLD